MVTSKNKARILAAASVLVDELGAAGLRVDAVARAAGLNKRMIYHYFGDRMGLLDSVYQYQAQCLLLPGERLDRAAQATLRELLTRCHLDLDGDQGVVPNARELSRAARILLSWLMLELRGQAQNPLENPGSAFAKQMLTLALPFLEPLAESERLQTNKRTNKPIYRVASASRMRN